MTRRRSIEVVLALPLVVASLAGACASHDEGSPLARGFGDARAGRHWIAAYGCGSCHTIPGVPGARGLVGPPLSKMGRRSFIAGEMANTPSNLVRWVMDPQAVEPGTAMPDLGVTEARARDIAAYLESL